MISNKQQGFTLIELVMVIVILGILAATALPKLVNLGSQARTSSVKALGGAVTSAVAIAESTYMALGQPAGTSGVYNMTTSDGTVVHINTTASTAPLGAPTGLGIVAMVPASTDYAITPSTQTDTSATITWTFSSSTTPASCTVVYTFATALVTTTTTGC
ncbi:MAG: prepilin-type N-terminal cleavage/methylation domain-containing protein [Methylomonas sp.]|jgi:MSHA pilin protein MshA